jgi:DNA-binding NtrC family response regulator
VNVRIISATNKIIEEEISAGRFRQDLLYRLNVIRLDLPPLRDRIDDIIPMAKFFMLRYSSRMNRKIHKIHPLAKKKLQAYSWPGNIRELENIIERAIIMAEQEIKPQDIYLPGDYKNVTGSQGEFQIPDEGISLDEIEKQVILQALERVNWVQKEAAALLKISGRVLNYKISKHKISHSSWPKNT